MARWTPRTSHQWRDRLPGGLAAGKKPTDFDVLALAQGILVELEHTTDPLVALEIAMDHLVESKRYYKDLAKMEHHKVGYGPHRHGTVPTWVRPPMEARKIAAQAYIDRLFLPASRRGGLSKTEATKQGITSGVERAESIIRGDWQPAEDVDAFFNRFRSTRAAAQHKLWKNSKVKQAWDLWGADPMWYAARKTIKQRKKTKTRPKKRSTNVRSLVNKALR